ncbi:hypothetical protein FXE87_11425 [Vibrio mimicus]|nr:hypothetical protein FXE87_11425 [Vibrio mimicus]
MDAVLTSIFVTVAVAHFLALFIPGTDFVLVVKSTIRNKGDNTISIAFCITLANAVYIVIFQLVLALFSLHQFQQ